MTDVGRPTTKEEPLFRAKRLRAYNLHLQGHSIRDIAAELGVSPGAVGKWAAKDKWRRRSDQIDRISKDLMDTVVTAELTEATKTFRARVKERIEELELACQGLNVSAIIAWLNRAGVPVRGEVAEEKPTGLVLRKDLKSSTPTEPAA